MYFNKTTELQPQFHFDEFPPEGVSQAVGSVVMGAGRQIGIFVIIQQEKGGRG